MRTTCMSGMLLPVLLGQDLSSLNRKMHAFLSRFGDDLEECHADARMAVDWRELARVASEALAIDLWRSHRDMESSLIPPELGTATRGDGKVATPCWWHATASVIGQSAMSDTP